jgi:16S rRNA (cytosine967-C5)-methyltransferase
MQPVPRTARAYALEALYDVIEKGEQPKILFNKAGCLDKRDRAFAMELLFGVLRYLFKIDYVLRQFMHRPDKTLNPWVKNILRIGTYQILFMDRVPESAAVNESVNLLYTYGPKNMSGFINGLLRSVIRKKETITWPPPDKDPVTYISTITSHPQWLVRRWVEREGFDRALKLSEANNVLPTLFLRINTLKIDRDSACELLKEKGIDCKATRYSPHGIEIGGKGTFQEVPEELKVFFQPQDEASQLISLLLDPRPGHRVIDACAAPGVKSTHIAQLMNNTGEILAVDISPERMNLLKENSKRWGCTIINTRVDEITRAPLWRECDRVLLDAPCSALGVIKRNPDIKIKRRESNLKEFHENQVRMLEKLKDSLRPGGVLLYSVCSTMEEETTQVIDIFLKKNKNFIKKNIEEFSDLCHNGFLLTSPLHHNMDGFFGARLCRIF